MSGTLYVVATPIGNLDDLSPRAREVLATVDVIAAEDTRHTRRLLSHFGIKTRLLAMHDHNEIDSAKTVVSELLDGRSVAIVSDAGTPLISDPGYRCVRAAHDAGITVSPIPGPAALIAALSVAGLPTDRFCFEGFLPAKRKARRARLDELRSEARTLVCYVSVHRIEETIEDLERAFGPDRPAFLGRELTKLHEECRSATLGELRRSLESGAIVQKGELVLVIGGTEPLPGSPIDTDRLLLELASKMSKADAARIVASVTGGKRRTFYERLLALEPDT